MKSKVILYGLTTCSHCKSVRNFLMDNKVDFDMIYVDALKTEKRREIINEIKKINPRASFPTLAFGDKVVVGFKKKELNFLLNELPKKS